ncbi:ABC transporter permease [Streptomyces sp. NBC_01304]|uniref:ABC transporter permease n=1 Tax=Streptomyces sp. NBC_01304 TaxID=2903818 RepID=UPI002E157622|nr:ABC transporter permease subunit [Streptomyces sp. NBC_01304]
MSALAQEPRARFRDLLAAEWIKLWSLRSTYWVLFVGALVVIGINVNSALSNADLLANQPAVNPRDPGMRIDPMGPAFVEPAYQILMLIAGSVGAISVFGEYTSGLIRTTFTAVPARRPVVAAKIVVVTVVTLVLGTVVAAASFGVTQSILGEYGGRSLGDPGSLRAVAGSALLAPVCAVVGMALGALIRHATGTVVAVVAALLLLPALFGGETYRWVAEIGNAMPLSAWFALIQGPTSTWDLGRYQTSVTEAWIVFAAWPLVAGLVAVFVVDRRDV